MSARTGHYSTPRSASDMAGTGYRHAPRWRAIARKATMLLAVVLCVGLLILSMMDTPITQRLRSSVMDLLYPAIAWVSLPSDGISSSAEQLDAWIFLHTENARLRTENAHLHQWQQTAQALARENAVMREFMQLRPLHERSFVTARVAGSTQRPYAQHIQLTSGSFHGIAPHQAVVAPHGLIGRVQEVGNISARVLLVNDINSRLPVRTGDGRYKALLVGDNSPHPLLKHLPTDAALDTAEQIVTAHDGNVIPDGLLVGETYKDQQGNWRVRTYVDTTQLDLVQIITPEVVQ